MIEAYNSDLINDYFNELINLLYNEDGRNESLQNEFKNNPEILYISDLQDFFNSKYETGLKEDKNVKSNISLIGRKYQKETKTPEQLSFYIKMKQTEYQSDFYELPLEISPNRKTTDIFYSFYEYSLIGSDNWNNQDVEQLLEIDIPNELLLHRSDYLITKLIEKFTNIIANYPDCLKRAKSFFQLDKEIDEKIILKNLILHYNKILNSNSAQLHVFLSVHFKKEISNLFTKLLIEFLTLRMNAISPEFEKYYLSEQTDQDTHLKEGEQIIYQLPEDFSLTKLNIKAKALDIKQAAILFYYLKDQGAILDYSNQSLAKLVHYLTGHSLENLRKNKGFGEITNILRETRQGIKYYNTIEVKKFLENIIIKLEKEIKN